MDRVGQWLVLVGPCRAGQPGPLTPHFYRQARPAWPPTPHFYRQGPGQPGLQPLLAHPVQKKPSVQKSFPCRKNNLSVQTHIRAEELSSLTTTSVQIPRFPCKWPRWHLRGDTFPHKTIFFVLQLAGASFSVQKLFHRAVKDSRCRSSAPGR